MTNEIPTVFLTRDREALREFDWIVGPVFGCYELPGSSPVVIVDQGAGAYAVVNRETRDYLGCCPKLELAVARAERA